MVTYRYRHPTEHEIHGMYENKIQIQTMNQIKTITYRILRYNYNINLSCFLDRLKYVCLLYSASDPYLKVKDPMIFQSE